MNDLVEELKEDSLSLKTIIEGMKNQQEYVVGQPSRYAHRLAKTFTKVQVYAKSLLMAASLSNKCDLQYKHKVLLQLLNRIPPPKERPRREEKEQEQIKFHLVLDVNGDMQEVTVNAGPSNAKESEGALVRRLVAFRLHSYDHAASHPHPPAPHKSPDLLTKF